MSYVGDTGKAAASSGDDAAALVFRARSLKFRDPYDIEILRNALSGSAPGSGA